MNYHNPIVWNEGMILEPQHFQQQERYFEHLNFQLVKNFHPFYWGLTDIEFDQQLLDIGKIALLKCRGFFQDGTYFDLPAVDMIAENVLPGSMTANSKIYLTFNIIQNEPDNLSLSYNQRHLTRSIPIPDTSQSHDEQSECLIRYNRPELQIGEVESHSKMAICIGQIEQVSSTGALTLRQDFIPNCICVGASEYLKTSISVIQQKLLETLQYLQSTFDHNTATFITISAQYYAQLDLLYQNSQSHPYEYFKILLQLRSCLTALHGATIRNYAYDHNDLDKSFKSISAEILTGLTQLNKTSVIELSLVQSRPSTYYVDINQELITSAQSFILGFQSEFDDDKSSQYINNHIKICSESDLEYVVSRALSGIDIYLLKTKPSQLFQQNDFIYYKINTNNHYWQSLLLTPRLIIHNSAQTMDFNIKLWAIKE